MKESTTTFQESPSQVVTDIQAFSVPSKFPAFSYLSIMRSRLLVMPAITTPLFYKSRLAEFQKKHLVSKLFTAVLSSRRELAADPLADSRRAK